MLTVFETQNHRHTDARTTQEHNSSNTVLTVVECRHQNVAIQSHHIHALVVTWVTVTIMEINNKFRSLFKVPQ